MERTLPQTQSLLIDANVFLEFLLDQERGRESVALMQQIETGALSAYVLSFALHGIEVILDRLAKPSALEQFLTRVVRAEGLAVYPTSPEEERQAVEVTRQVALDFDDALHYYVCTHLNLTLVSFDTDFDRTDITRVEPSHILSR